jgi:hypothetical protein
LIQSLFFVPGPTFLPPSLCVGYLFIWHTHIKYLCSEVVGTDSNNMKPCGTDVLGEWRKERTVTGTSGHLEKPFQRERERAAVQMP